MHYSIYCVNIVFVLVICTVASGSFPSVDNVGL